MQIGRFFLKPVKSRVFSQTKLIFEAGNIVLHIVIISSWIVISHDNFLSDFLCVLFKTTTTTTKTKLFPQTKQSVGKFSSKYVVKK